MDLELHGKPVHSRSLDVEATFSPDARWDVRGELVDLRKAGLRADRGRSAARRPAAPQPDPLSAAERSRGPADLDDPCWSELPEVQGLVGAPLLSAMTQRILAAFAARAAGDPAVDLLLQLAPGLLQCASSLTEAWPALAARSPSRIVCAGGPDSCYIWRRGGALDTARLSESEGEE